MEIIIQTDDELSTTDRAILRALLGEQEPAENGSVEEPKAKPAKKSAKKAAAAKAKPEPEEEPAEDDDTDEDAEPSAEASMEAAVELATQLVSNGKSDVVKAILADLGVKRVSELKEDDVAAFIEAAS